MSTKQGGGVRWRAIVVWSEVSMEMDYVELVVANAGQYTIPYGSVQERWSPELVEGYAGGNLVSGRRSIRVLFA